MSRFPENARAGASPADLNWLSGAWQGENGPDRVEEYRSALGGNSLIGMFRWVKEGKVSFYELIAIEPEDDFVFLRIKHFHPKLIGWEEKDDALELVLVQRRNKEAVFLELDRPDARWAIYRLENENRLVSYFATENEAVTAEGLFAYARRP